MRKSIYRRLFLLIYLLSPILLLAQPWTSYPPLNLNFQIDSVKITDGLDHYLYQSDSLSEAPLSINVLRIDLAKIRLSSALAMDQIIGQETTSQMVQRKGALAGINGGFSFSNNPWNIFHGDPRDLLVFDGQILSTPYSTRASFGYRDGLVGQEIFMEPFGWHGQICDENDYCLQLTGINQQRGADDLILYTPEYNRTTMTENDGMEYVFSEDEVISYSVWKGSQKIPEDGYVISASGRYKDSLAYFFRGKGRLKQRLHPLDAAENTFNLNGLFLHTAGPVLIKNQQAVTDHSEEDIPESFTLTRHPRTAIGYDRDQHLLYWVVVDGRRERWSVGLSLPELTYFFQRLQVTDAYNLDGGGSSTMVIKGEIMNKPSDPKERRRCDAVLLYKK